MAAIIGITGTRNWNNTAAWVGGVIPSAASNDTTRWVNGMIITVPSGYTASVGDAANPSTHAITATADGTGATVTAGGTARLIVDGTLEFYGNIRFGNANIVVNAGGAMESKNTTTQLTLQIADADGQANARLTLAGTGTGANRARLRKGSGSAGWRITNGGFTRAEHVWSWFSAEGLGDSSNPSVLGALFTGTPSMTFDDGYFDTCGTVAMTTWNAPVGANIRMRRVTMTNTQGTNSYSFTAIDNPTGVRLFEDCSFDKFGRYVGNGHSHRRVLYRNKTDFNKPVALWEDCILGRSDAATGPIINFHGPSITWTRGFLAATNVPGSGGWHGVGLTTATAGSITIDGMVIDGAVTTQDGDLLSAGTPTAALTVNVRNVLMTAASNGSKAYGKLTSSLGNANFSWGDLIHNTAFTDVGEPRMFCFGETYAGRTGMVTGVIKSNLAMCTTAGNGVLIGRVAAGAVANIQDYVAPANVTNNVCQNARNVGGVGIGNSTEAGGTGVMWSTTPAAPLDVDPAMVDSTRNLATYYRSVVGGTAGTRSADMLLFFDAIASLNTDSPVSGFTQATVIRDAWDWIRAGLAPTNPAAQAAHDGLNGNWIGAVPGVASTLRQRRTFSPLGTRSGSRHLN